MLTMLFEVINAKLATATLSFKANIGLTYMINKNCIHQILLDTQAGHGQGGQNMVADTRGFEVRGKGISSYQGPTQGLPKK